MHFVNPYYVEPRVPIEIPNPDKVHRVPYVSLDIVNIVTICHGRQDHCTKRAVIAIKSYK